MFTLKIHDKSVAKSAPTTADFILRLIRTKTRTMGVHFAADLSQISVLILSVNDPLTLLLTS